jgi:hypothetical protein
MRSTLHAATLRLTARRRLVALQARQLAAVRAADAADTRLHGERRALLEALAVEPRGPLSAAHRVDLEARHAALLLEVMVCRHAANRARAALRIVRSPQFRHWFGHIADRRVGDVALVSAFCAAHPADPLVLDLSVRTELVPAR